MQASPSAGQTDFSRYSHAQLVQMLFAGSPKSVKEAAETWASAGKYLHEQAGDVDQQLGKFSDKWAGTAADQYKTMVTDLGKGIRTAADTMLKVRDLAFSAAEALEEAQRVMPMPVSVPTLAPSTVATAATPVPLSDGHSTATTVDMQQRQADAVKAVSEHREAQASADAAHQEAIRVMTKLAGHYTATYSAMPAIPTAASPPTLDNQQGASPPATLPGSPGHGLTLVPPVSNDNGAGAPLFSKMFGAGMAAASAALGGRFANFLPRLIGRDKEAKERKAKEAGMNPASQPSGGAGGSGVGGGAPKLSSGLESPGGPMSGGSGVSGVSGLQAASAAGAAGGAVAGRPMGMMPMMPFAPMGADGMGGRRIPPWLVETENVWGEPSVVAPPVIGEDPDTAKDTGNNHHPWS